MKSRGRLTKVPGGGAIYVGTLIHIYIYIHTYIPINIHAYIDIDRRLRYVQGSGLPVWGIGLAKAPSTQT